MTERNQGYNYNRYRSLLAEATDESKRLALIELLIEEGAREQLTRDRIGRLGLSQPLERRHNQSEASELRLSPALESSERG